MSDFPVDVRAKNYVTEKGSFARSLRPFAVIEAGPVRPACFVDTGAPFSIVTVTVAQRIRWQPLGAAFVAQGISSPIDWQGIPCDFGETNITLHDPATATRSRPLRLAGKFARARHPVLEGFVILGMNFLADNSIDFVLHGVPGSASGMLSVP